MDQGFFFPFFWGTTSISPLTSVHLIFFDKKKVGNTTEKAKHRSNGIDNCLLQKMKYISNEIIVEKSKIWAWKNLLPQKGYFWGTKPVQNCRVPGAGLRCPVPVPGAGLSSNRLRHRHHVRPHLTFWNFKVLFRWNFSRSSYSMAL